MTLLCTLPLCVCGTQRVTATALLCYPLSLQCVAPTGTCLADESKGCATCAEDAPLKCATCTNPTYVVNAAGSVSVLMCGMLRCLPAL